MSFRSRDVEDYLKVLRNPDFGSRMVVQQKLLQKRQDVSKKKHLVKSVKDVDVDEDDPDAELFDDNGSSIDEEDAGYDSDASENEYADVEEARMADDEVSRDDNQKPEGDLEFQILDIDFYHAENEDDKKTFNIMLFGKTKEDKSVYVNVEGYRPYFYVEIDERWRKPICDRVIKDVEKRVKKDLKTGLIDFDIIQAHKFHGFTNDEKFNFLKLVFDDYDSMRAYARAFEMKHALPYISRQRKISFKLYESNINPILRFLHIRNIDPIGWCKIPQNKFKPFGEGHRKGTTDINVNCIWKDVERVECNDIHKFKILSFDIECTSEDGKFPQNRDGDKIIQIGMTYSYLGDPECFKQVILCLKKTAPIPGAEVRCFSTEEDLMLAFTNEIRRQDPDIITGYNIFGFDFDYMKNRAKKFGIYSQFSRLSRIKGFVCNYVEQKLESSAMGRNNLKYYNTPGRVHIDLMKFIQREHKLGGYSLDSVAANFIRDKVESFEYIYVGDQKAIDLSVENEDDEILAKEEDEEEEEEEVDKEEDDDSYSSDEDEEPKKKVTKVVKDVKDSKDKKSQDSEEVLDDFDDDVHVRKKNVDNTKKRRIAYTKLKVKSTSGIKKHDYVSIYYNDGPTDNRIGYKYKVFDMDDKSLTLKGKIRIRPYLKRKWKVFWCQAKDDVGPKDIFRMFKMGEKERAIVAKYCLKDCSLCNRLMAKLQILPNSIGMGNVCCVPLSYLFLRGQSVKIFSLVAKQCREENYIIPTVKKKVTKPPQTDASGKIIETAEQQEERRFQKFAQLLVNDEENDDDEEDETYEGATVFDPVTGLHYEPIIVGDYSSLYPSSMIMKNLSHNSIVLDPKYDNLPGYRYHQQAYRRNDGTEKVCRFAEKIGDDPMKTKSTIPRILMKLLATRKKCNAMKETEKDPFKKAVWDGLQLAYKITANSLYGQCGSAVSPISMKDIAACTTSIGRDMLELARNFVENQMKDIINLVKDAVESKDDTKFLEYMRNYYKDVKDSRVEMKEKVKDADGKVVMENDKPKEQYVYKGKEEYYQWLKKQIYDQIGNYNIDPKCIYGDTDSVFFKLNLVDRKTGLPFVEHGALKISIKMGILCTAILNHTLDYPQGLAYEKVYWPFIIISKKRYVGNLYSFDPNDFYQKSMGLVTKRRDNADIVKIVVGGIIDQMLNKRSKKGAVEFTKSRLMKIITGKYDIDKFIISKTLKDKEAYADWTKQVHVVLADRMAQRDPGNKPQSNDRIPFVYIEVNKKVKLQGERVEHPAFIKEKKLKIDYLFYITNQIMKPATQFLELITKKPEVIFNRYIIREQNRKAGIDPIMKYFKDCPTDQGNEVVVKINGLTGDDLFGKKLGEGRTNNKRIEKRKKVVKRIV
ncbi:DNA polymerase family B elongation subunit [Yasminevirus sp. GU-2018]|uniref:DNA-directed DNA polymerase n=1 Tax=Yasminevirus sp. GU-2018 TaxID=2420051 RepID=A0A5K0U7P4_9VIRU|nr:DNA polymerase family B elongation subunit [Yasminevirus sp. GU-2018]